MLLVKDADTVSCSFKSTLWEICLQNFCFNNKHVQFSEMKCHLGTSSLQYRLFVSIKRTGAQNASPFLPQKSGENSSSYLQNAGRFGKTFTAEILVQTAKYCLPQITYLLIHFFGINFRQGNVKLVLLKEFKPIILHVASENQLFCECRKFIGNV